MPHLARRNWTPPECEDLVQRIAHETADRSSIDIDTELASLIDENRNTHEDQCINLNPATNIMNPRAEAALAAGLGSRPSLGYPGDKYEMGLEAIERIEIICAELAAEVFQARHAEIRVPSGAIANLYAFMATAAPGDAVIVPPAPIGGHVTHHAEGAAGLYGLKPHPAPVKADGYTIDVAALSALAHEVRPALITVGGSLNLFPHPVAEVRAIADDVGAKVLFDAAHLCGMIAGGTWENPLGQGAHLMTMSTYKSLGGPAGGLVVTNDDGLAEKLDKIAFPGLTANFDAAKSAALAITLLDWREHGRAYAERMCALAARLATALKDLGAPVFETANGITASHQFALDATAFGGGQTAAKRLRRANILSCGIGLPIEPVDGDVNGLRLGTPEIARIGMTEDDMTDLAALVHRGLTANDADAAAAEVTGMRRRFTALRFIRS